MNAELDNLTISAAVKDLKLKDPFSISGHTFTYWPIVQVEITRDGKVGRGEAGGVYYLSDNVEKILADIDRLSADMPQDLDRERLMQLMSPCSARNAIDCALWELEAAEQGKALWELADIEAPKPLLTTVTLGAEAPEAMAERAKSYDFAKALKLKLTGDPELDGQRVKAVREARNDVWMGVDPNQGYTPDTIKSLIPVLTDCNVELLEQPFARGAEHFHDDVDYPISLAADESCLDLKELETLPGRFDVVNIKLDKCGGLTEGIKIAQRAKELGLKVMVGNMICTSMGAAPAFILGQFCSVVDIDGPLFIDDDQSPSVTYEDGYINCSPDVWGRGK